jgi:hypothetical protein
MPSGTRRSLLQALAEFGFTSGLRVRPAVAQTTPASPDALVMDAMGELRKEAVGMPDLTLHDLRRSTGTGLQRIGCPAYVISVVLGHRREAGSFQTDAHYVHGGRPDEHCLWLDRWSAHVEKLIGEGSGASAVSFPQPS